MPTPSDFFVYTQWSALLMVGCGVLAGLAFVFSWGFRFRLVGATGFMGVLTAGLFALSLVPLTHTVIPDAVRFSVVYDSGAEAVVIAVPPTITETQLKATLQQAAVDTFSPGRIGRGQREMTIRARTVLHPEAGVSIPFYLGEARPSLSSRANGETELTIFTDRLAQLPQA